MSNRLDIPGLKQLIWYEKINLTEQLITTLVPEEINTSNELLEIIYITDKLLGLTPPERLDLAIQLLTEIKQTYFTR